MTPTRISYGRILVFWAPLAGTWLMMSVEGPFLTALIARLSAPKENLAAFGIAFAFALIIESPIINLLSASTALVRGRASFFSLRKYTYTLNVGLTVVMVVALLPRVFAALAWVLNLDPEVARLTHGALALLLPWPAAIGYRRFHQGVLVRHDMTRRVAYGTIVRLVGMSGTGLLGWQLLSLPGAWLGALALSVGVLAEAAASRLMAQALEKRLITDVTPSGAQQGDRAMGFGEISAFYVPLAMTSILAMAVHPMVTFFMGRARLPLESLAVLPVVYGFTFFFRALGLSYQEVVIALIGERGENYSRLRNFSLGLALSATAGLVAIAFSPLASLWYRQVAGLSTELAEFALLPTRIFALIPALSVMMSFQRSLLVSARRTRPLTAATMVEVGGIATILFLCIFALDLVGAVAAATALIFGRSASNAYLFGPCWRVVAELDEREPVAESTTVTPGASPTGSFPGASSTSTPASRPGGRRGPGGAHPA